MGCSEWTCEANRIERRCCPDDNQSNDSKLHSDFVFADRYGPIQSGFADDVARRSHAYQ